MHGLLVSLCIIISKIWDATFTDSTVVCMSQSQNLQETWHGAACRAVRLTEETLRMDGWRGGLSRTTRQNLLEKQEGLPEGDNHHAADWLFPVRPAGPNPLRETSRGRRGGQQGQLLKEHV